MARHASSNHRSLPHGIAILYEDRDIVVIDKPAGLLTMGTDSDKTRTAYYYLTDYVRKGFSKSRERIFIVHRLDRETSGVVIFARNFESKTRLQDNWQATTKKYLAVVHGQCANRSGTITNYLAENKAHIVYSTSDKKLGKLSTTGYQVLRQTRDFALLELDLLTGRKHQIRVHLAASIWPASAIRLSAMRNTVREIVIAAEWRCTRARFLSNILFTASGLPLSRQCRLISINWSASLNLRAAAIESISGIRRRRR